MFRNTGRIISVIATTLAIAFIERRKNSRLSVSNITTIMMLSFGLCCAAAIQIGQSKHEYHNTLALAVCGKQICLHGIALGMTTWDDAVRELGEKVVVNIDDGQIRLQIYPSIDGKYVGRMVMQLPPDGSLTVADLLLLFGAPCKVSKQVRSHYVTLNYSGMSYRIYALNHHLDTQSPVTLIQLDASTDRDAKKICLTDLRQGDVLVETYEWRGLASLTRYGDE